MKEIRTYGIYHNLTTEHFGEIELEGLKIAGNDPVSHEQVKPCLLNIDLESLVSKLEYYPFCIF